MDHWGRSQKEFLFPSILRRNTSVKCEEYDSTLQSVRLILYLPEIKVAPRIIYLIYIRPWYYDILL